MRERPAAVLRDPATREALDRVWARVSRRRDRIRTRTRAVSFATVFAVVALVAAGLAWHTVRRARGTHMASTHGGDGVLRSAFGVDIPRRIDHATTLDDGSSVVPAEGGALDVLENDARGFALLLVRGEVSVEVTPGGMRRWSIECGLATVEVVGTGFTVRRREAAVDVDVRHGVVLVRSRALADGVRRLGAGESLVVAAPVDAVAVANPPATDVSATSAKVPHAHRSRETPGTGSASAESLLDAADRTRRAGDPAGAAMILERLVVAHPADPRAAIAALTLARLEMDALDRPRRAGRAFEQALALGLPADLVADARAGCVDAYTRAGETALAASAARAYLAQFPDGPHAPRMRSFDPR